MVYLKGENEEEEAHKRFCSQIHSITLPRLNGLSKLDKNAMHTDDNIYEVDRVKLDTTTYAQLKDAVSRDLGCERDFLDEEGTRLFVCVRTRESKQVIGCIATKAVDASLTSVMRAIDHVTDIEVTLRDVGGDSGGFCRQDTDNKENVLHSTDDDCEPEPLKHEERDKIETQQNNLSDSNGSEVLMGIHCVWVHSKCRSQGVATKLVDACRQHFLFGQIIPRSALAFSQPTSDGKAFALTYIQGSSMRVYS
jgi:ribosomal protein S18 acetylase RimI-like enzyme